MARYTVRTEFTRKSLATLLREHAEATGRTYSASTEDTRTGVRLVYRFDGIELTRDQLMSVQETGQVEF